MKNKLFIIIVFALGLSLGWLSSVPNLNQPEKQNIQDQVNKQNQPVQADMDHLENFDAQLKFVELMSESGFKVDEKYLTARSQLGVKHKQELDEQLLRYANMLFTKKATDEKLISKLQNLLGNDDTDKLLLEMLATLQIEKTQYQKAIESLIELKRLAQYSDEYEEIDKQIHIAAEQNIEHLKNEKEFSKLMEFFEFLTTRFPSEFSFKWLYAKYAFDRSQYEKAQYLLDELRYVPEYSDQVAKLSDNITFRLNNDATEGVIVNLIKKGESYFVKAIIDEYEPVRLLIDTGASMTVITPELAYSLGLLDQEIEHTMTFQTANGEVRAPIALLGKLRIANYVVEDLQVGILPISNGVQFQGLLGMNFLKQFKFFIDQQNLTLELLANQ